jgi:osmotically-inducible protein OsmY
MKRSSKMALTGAVLLIFMMGLALVVTKAVLNSTSVKSKIETAVSDTLDMDFKIEGRINLGFFPFLWLAVNNISVSRSSELIASASQIKIDPHLLDLWSLKVHIEDLDIHSPRLKLDPEVIKKILALEGKESEASLPVESLVIDSFSVSNAKFFYSDDDTTVDIDEMNFRGGGISIIENRKMVIDDVVSFIKAINFTGDVSGGQITSQAFKLENIKADVKGEKGLLSAEPIEMVYFGEQAEISGFLNLMENTHHVQILIEMPELDLEKFRKRSEAKDIIKGVIHLRGEFEAHGADIDELLKDINGNFSIKGQNLTLKGIDVDKALDEFDKMRGYGFKDFAALVMIGPLGVVVSHGYDQLETLEKIMTSTGDSMIQVLVSDWNVVKGVVTAEDVAFSTQRNRVVVKGSLDIPNEKFKSVTIAIVDSDGCIVNSETVDGPFKNPEVKEAGILERTVLRPLKRMFNTDCELFYNGLVPHPTGQRGLE